MHDHHECNVDIQVILSKVRRLSAYGDKLVVENPIGYMSYWPVKKCTNLDLLSHWTREIKFYLNDIQPLNDV